MKTVCEICEETHVLAFDERFKGVDIVACRKCGLVWNRRMMDEPEQLEFYKKHNRARGAVSRKYLISMLARAACAVEFLGCRLQPGMRHLDVGCAEGTLLALTRAHGLEVQGLEIDVNHSRFAREVRHLQVLPMTLETAPLTPASFDLVSFVHVAEHLVHPVQVLGVGHRLLRDEGLLYVEVPNMNQPLPGLRHFFRPKHNFYFTANTLRAVVSKAGFAPLRLGYSARDGSVQLLAVKSPRREATLPGNLPRWRDDARKMRAKVRRERTRQYLLLSLLFINVFRQGWVKRQALRRYGALLPELQSAPD